jgi:hypothetical protein
MLKAIAVSRLCQAALGEGGHQQRIVSCAFDLLYLNWKRPDAASPDRTQKQAPGAAREVGPIGPPLQRALRRGWREDV